MGCPSQLRLWDISQAQGCDSGHLVRIGKEARPYLFVREALTPGPWQERLGQGCERDQRPVPALSLPGPP